MKIIRIVIPCLCASMLVACCNRGPLDGIDANGARNGKNLGECTVLATVEQPAVTASEQTAVNDAQEVRSTLDSDGCSVLWSAGDSFAAYGANGEAARFDLSEGSGTEKGKFSGTFAGQAPYTLIYPYSENAALSDGWLSFDLPSQQQYKASAFADGVNPAIASCGEDGTAQFHNLCGVLKLSIKGKGQQLSKIVLHDLAGNMLWGRASVLIDGKEGTPEQSMKLSGGDNTLTLAMDGITINTVSTKTFYFIVPAGTLDRGFTVSFHTIKGEVFGFVQTQAPNIIQRSVLTTMPTATTSTLTEPAVENARGYYKDLFMDGGIRLTSRKILYASDLLGWSMEHFASNSEESLYTQEDTLIQSNLFAGTEDDPNGVLLYPDGEPRFRAIYINGGSAGAHGTSLTRSGIENVNRFVSNGGSYVGSCAGAFISSMGTSSSFPNANYFNVWPGLTYGTYTDSGQRVRSTETGLSVEPGCPLLNYYDLGERMNGVKHNGGCYVVPGDQYWPAGTEVLLRFYCPGADSTKLHGSVNAWAYKAGEKTGRVVCTGSHPEVKKEGKQLNCMAAMLAYAADGCGAPDIKELSAGTDTNGILGDGQYHHYRFTVTDSGEKTITLSGDAGVDLALCLRKEGPAWITDSQYLLTTTGSDKQLTIKSLEPGDWYIGVYCTTLVKATKTSYGTDGEYYKYSGKTAVLKGVSYTIGVK